MFEQTAYDIYIEEKSQKPVITLCRAFDRSLGGGIHTGIITEFCGPPGSGKTQMCKQLAINVQFPVDTNGRIGFGGKAIYIDTNQSFNPQRFQEMAKHACILYKIFCKHSSTELSKRAFESENILKNISYTYCQNFFELVAAVELIKGRVESDPNIKLIVIDSFSFLCRRSESYAVRTQALFELLTDLQVLADNHHLAVIITNELTTRLETEGESSYPCPALGDSIRHKIGQRILFGANLNRTERVVFLDKCLASKRKYIKFKITEAGIRGLG